MSASFSDDSCGSGSAAAPPPWRWLRLVGLDPRCLPAGLHRVALLLLLELGPLAVFDGLVEHAEVDGEAALVLGVDWLGLELVPEDLHELGHSVPAVADVTVLSGTLVAGQHEVGHLERVHAHGVQSVVVLVVDVGLPDELFPGLGRHVLLGLALGLGVRLEEVELDEAVLELELLDVGRRGDDGDLAVDAVEGLPPAALGVRAKPTCAGTPGRRRSWA